MWAVMPEPELECQHIVSEFAETTLGDGYKNNHTIFKVE